MKPWVHTGQKKMSSDEERHYQYDYYVCAWVVPPLLGAQYMFIDV